MDKQVKTKLSHPVPELPVMDVEKAQKYYQDVLGFDIAWSDPSKTIGAVVRDEITLFLSKRTNVSPASNWIFADDIDATFKEMEKRGAIITETLQNKPWNLRQFSIVDCDGNRFTFHHDL